MVGTKQCDHGIRPALQGSFGDVSRPATVFCITERIAVFRKHIRHATFVFDRRLS